MAYARIPDELGIDDRYLEAVDACPAAGTLVLFGYSYAAREESDGHVPRRQLRRMLDDPDLLEQAIVALVDAGLWARTDDGIEMLDYLHAGRNMTRAEWKAKREGERDRKARWRAGKKAESADDDPEPPGVSPDCPDGTDAGQDAGQTPDGTPDDGRPSLTCDRAPAPAQTLTQNPKGDGGGDERADAGEPGNTSAVVPLVWAQAVAALVTAGISREAIAAQRDELADELRSNTRPIAWPAAGRWLKRKRDRGECSATPNEPASALRFVLNSPSAPVVGGRPRRRPGSRQPTPAARFAPVAGDQAAAIMTPLLKDARRQIGDDAWDTWLGVLRLVGTSQTALLLEAPDHTISWMQHRLVPLLAASATRTLDRPMTVQVVARQAVPA